MSRGAQRVYHFEFNGNPLCQGLNVRYMIKMSDETRGRKVCKKCIEFRKHIKKNRITADVYNAPSTVMIHLAAKHKQILSAWANYLNLPIDEVAKKLIERNITELATMLHWPEVTYS